MIRCPICLKELPRVSELSSDVYCDSCHFRGGITFSDPKRYNGSALEIDDNGEVLPAHSNKEEE